MVNDVKLSQICQENKILRVLLNKRQYHVYVSAVGKNEITTTTDSKKKTLMLIEVHNLIDGCKHSALSLGLHCLKFAYGGKTDIFVASLSSCQQ